MANITNIHDLPAPLVSALNFDDYEKGAADISATGLIKPPRIRQLEIRHKDEIVEDVSERIWAVLGQIGHKILERADTDNHLAEERLFATVNGWRISGQADLLDPDMTLTDWKFTSVWAVKDEKPEWTQQLNVYAWLYRENGFTVKRARIVAILRDWSKLRAAREPDYPQVGVVVREVPLWPAEQQFRFVWERVSLHKFGASLADNVLAECSAEERWHRGDTWAVKKKGNKRAIPNGLHDTREAAQLHQADLAYATELEHRPGADVRCESYCRVAPFCNQRQNYLNNLTTEGFEKENKES